VARSMSFTLRFLSSSTTPGRFVRPCDFRIHSRRPGCGRPLLFPADSWLGYFRASLTSVLAGFPLGYQNRRLDAQEGFCYTAEKTHSRGAQ
jgi:hypothetical protein